MIDEWSGTLTLTEASSRELMRVLEKQDAEFMDALFNGECGFTLKCTDGRSVELVPKADRKTKPQIDDFFREPTAEERKAVAEYIESISIPTGVNVFDLMDEPQTDKGVSYSDHTDYKEPKTYVTWTEPQTEGEE